jgi:hypothetical protein
LRELMTRARAAGLLKGEPAEMVEHFAHGGMLRQEENKVKYNLGVESDSIMARGTLGLALGLG